MVELPADGKKESKPASEKKETKKSTKKKEPKKTTGENVVFLQTQIDTLLQVSFSITASKTGVPSWVITSEESQSIAKPLSKIIDRMSGGAIDERTSDIIALIMAVGVVVAPRTIAHIEMKKIEKKGVIKREQKRETPTIDRQDNRGTSHVNPNSVKNVLESISY